MKITRVIKYWHIFAIVLLLFGCSKGSLNEGIDSELGADGTDIQDDVYSIAQEYVNNILFVHDNYTKNIDRSLQTDPYGLDYFEGMIIEMPDKTEKTFYELTDSEKEQFLDNWVPYTVEEMVEDMTDDENELAYITCINDAFQISRSDESRGMITNYGEFAESLTTELANDLSRIEITVKQAEYRLNAGRSFTTVRDFFYAYYKKGRVLYVNGSSSALFNGNWGHNAICTAGSLCWEEAWEDDYNYRITTSAWGDVGDGPDLTEWDGSGCKEVQTEPFELYFNDRPELDIDNLYMMRIGNKKWIFWPFSSTWTEATDSEHIEAADYAYGKLGTPYAATNGQVINAKTSEEYYTCSSLMYHSWKSVDSKYNLSRTFIAPLDVYKCQDTKIAGQVVP